MLKAMKSTPPEEKVTGPYSLRGAEDAIPAGRIRAAVRQELGEVYERLEHIEETTTERLERVESMLKQLLAGTVASKKPSVRISAPALKDSEVQIGGQYLTELHSPRGKVSTRVMVIREEKMRDGRRGWVCVRLTGSERTRDRKLQPRPASALYPIPDDWQPASTDMDDLEEEGADVG